MYYFALRDCKKTTLSQKKSSFCSSDMAAECILIGPSSQFNTYARTQMYKQWLKQKMFIMHIALALF